MSRRKEDLGSVMALAFSEILRRMSVEEKKIFAQTVDLTELEELKIADVAADEKRRVGDPKFYVGTTPGGGLSLELPVDKVVECIETLPAFLSSTQIKLLILGNGEWIEFFCSESDFPDILRKHTQSIIEEGVMIDFDASNLVSGGRGCISLDLKKPSPEVTREIAGEFLEICGFKHRFRKDEFSAVVWKDILEVTE